MTIIAASILISLFIFKHGFTLFIKNGTVLLLISSNSGYFLHYLIIFGIKKENIEKRLVSRCFPEGRKVLSATCFIGD